MFSGLTLVFIVLAVFVLLVLLRVPVGFAMLAAGFVYVLNAGIQPGNIVIRMNNSIDNVVYLALPFYLMAAELMLAICDRGS